jgi:hypothetical protein
LEDNIKTKFKEIGWGNGIVSSGAGGNKWWADVNTVMNCAADVVGCIEDWVMRNLSEAKMCFRSSGFRYKLVLMRYFKLVW